MVSACRRDEIEDLPQRGCIALTIAEQSPSSTRSNSVESTIKLNNSTIALSFVEQDNIGVQYVEATRGAAVDNTTNPISKIYATALCADGKPFFSDVEVAIDNQKGATNYFWPDQELSFFAYTTSDDNLSLSPTFACGAGSYTGTFNYSLPAAGTSSPRKDATAQPDLLFAITPDQSAEQSTEVELMFHHALSAIVFKVGTMPAGVTLKSIAISGVYESGSCSMAHSGTKDIEFTWSFAGKSQSSTYFVEDINKAAVEGEMMGSDQTIFMMLPQTMSDKAMLHLAFTMDGVDYTFEKQFNSFISAWEADKKYIFTIGLPDKIDVEVDDQVEGVVKRDVTIQNTGVVTGYIRAAIVGYWRNNQGQIEKPWIESQGTYNWGSNWSSNWVKGSDGFYYHLHPVTHGQFTHPLFESYTLTDETVAARGTLTLEINIVAQIIPLSAVDSWPVLDALVE